MTVQVQGFDWVKVSPNSLKWELNVCSYMVALSTIRRCDCAEIEWHSMSVDSSFSTHRLLLTLTCKPVFEA